MTITTLTEKAIAVTGLPEGFIRATVYMGYLICKAHNIENGVTDEQLEDYAKLQKYLANHKPEKDYKEVPFKLPEGNWTMLGRADELTEDDWKRVVERHDLYEGSLYYNYTGDIFFTSARESGHSLLKSKGLYVSNPLMSEKPITVIGHKGQEKICELILKKFQDQWQSAELLTNPLILIRE